MRYLILILLVMVACATKKDDSSSSTTTSATTICSSYLSSPNYGSYFQCVESQAGISAADPTNLTRYYTLPGTSPATTPLQVTGAYQSFLIRGLQVCTDQTNCSIFQSAPYSPYIRLSIDRDASGKIVSVGFTLYIHVDGSNVTGIAQIDIDNYGSATQVVSGDGYIKLTETVRGQSFDLVLSETPSTNFGLLLYMNGELVGSQFAQMCADAGCYLN